MPDRPYVDNHEERVRRRRDEDVPTIGDYSEEWDQRVGLTRSKARQPVHAPEPQQAARAREESWRLDPQEVRRRNAELARRRRRPSLRVAALLLALAGAIAAFLTLEPLRSVGETWLAAARGAFEANRGETATPPPGGSASNAAPSPAPAVVAPQEPPASAATAESTPPLAPRRAATAAPLTVGAADAARVEPAVETIASNAVDAPVAEPTAAPPAAPPRPAEPPAPERFEFVTSSVSVSESAAGARVQIRRSGGTLAESTIAWWTTDGSATAGADYADLGAIIERFARGERTRTIYIPIVADANAEARESFYVNLGESPQAGDSLAASQRVEVVVEDDD
jgi:hypothetical protein